MIQFSQTPIFYYWYCSVHSVEFFSTASLNRDAGLERDAALIAMRCFGAQRGAPRRYKDLLHQHDYAGEHHREGGWRGYHCGSHHDPGAINRNATSLNEARHTTSLQTPFPHMRMSAPPPPYAHTMLPACLPLMGLLRFLQRCGTPRWIGRGPARRASTRYARHRPYQERNSQSRKLIEM